MMITMLRRFLASVALTGVLASSSLALADHVAPAVTGERLPVERKLPAPLKAKGKRVLAAWRFAGANNATGYLVLSATDTSGKAGRSRQLYAQLYAGKKQTQVRLVQDGIKNCQLDMTASFVPGSITFLDVDGDDQVEAAFAYDLGCDATERPTPRKLIVLEGSTKIALRGNGRGKDLDGNPTGGDHVVDKVSGQDALVTWAETRWAQLLDIAAVDADP